MRAIIGGIFTFITTGGAYLPIDVSYPAPLIIDIVEDVKPKAVFVSTKYRHQINGYRNSIPQIMSIWIYHLTKYKLYL